MFFQQFVGINALVSLLNLPSVSPSKDVELIVQKIYYSPTLFGTMGLNHSMQLIMSGILNVTQVSSSNCVLMKLRAENRKACWRQHKPVDNGSLWATSVASLGQLLHDCLPCNNCNSRGNVLKRLAFTPGRGVDKCSLCKLKSTISGNQSNGCIVVVLHA